MNLPPLPEPDAMFVMASGASAAFFATNKMQAYGQACRDAALVEAAHGITKLVTKPDLLPID